jgi:hypothetical protein
MRRYVRQSWERAESGEANAELARDAESNRIWKAVAGKWRRVGASASSAVSHDEWAATSLVRSRGLSPLGRKAPLTAEIFGGSAPIRILFGKDAEIQYGSGSQDTYVRGLPGERERPSCGCTLWCAN